MSKNKGRTWEEIYGVEGARKRREESIPKSIKNRPSKKGLKWEDIYSPEEVDRRRNEMCNNNPSNKLTEDQKRDRALKGVQNRPDSSGENNSFFGKHHTEETKQRMRDICRVTHSTAEFKNKVRDSLNEYHADKYHIVSCLFCGKDIRTTSKRNKKFCNAQCLGYYNIYNGQFKREPNTWEQKIIDLNITGVEYTGDHSFWIDLVGVDGKVRKKNPDFIIIPFSKSKKVIEVVGSYWHTEEDNMELMKEYLDKGIEVLLLYGEDIEDSNLKYIIEDFIKCN